MLSRRGFLGGLASGTVATLLGCGGRFGGAGTGSADGSAESDGSSGDAFSGTALDDPRIIDVHQHTSYSGRPDAVLVSHQRRLGVTTTLLLPAGSQGGLAAGVGPNEDAVAVVNAQPLGEFRFCANEVPSLPETREVLERYLMQGGVGIGEQKFGVACDSPAIFAIAEIARAFRVPMTLHIEHQRYNLGYERFHRTLEAFPDVAFIGHAQTFWGNIDRDHVQTVLYPTGPVTPGGLTDRFLSDYPNCYGDLSAGSGLNALLRDEAHARAFLERHQDRLLFGTDCADHVGTVPQCLGAELLATLRRLAPSGRILRKILFDNAARLFKLA